MKAKDKQQLLGKRNDLIWLVERDFHETAFCLVEEILGGPDKYGWGIEATVDLTRRIVRIQPGNEGVELAVDYLCGFYRHDRSWNTCVRAGFEQRIDEARDKPWVLGFRMDTLEHGCSKSKALRGCYKLGEVPSFPLPKCSAEPFCCCGLYELLEGVDDATAWRKQ